MGSQPCIALSFPPKSFTNRMATQYYIVVSLRSIFWATLSNNIFDLWHIFFTHSPSFSYLLPKSFLLHHSSTLFLLMFFLTLSSVLTFMQLTSFFISQNGESLHFIFQRHLSAHPSLLLSFSLDFPLLFVSILLHNCQLSFIFTLNFPLLLILHVFLVLITYFSFSASPVKATMSGSFRKTFT